MIGVVFLYVWKYFYIGEETERSIFGENYERSKKVPKSIGICPQGLIRHFNPIINHANPKNTMGNAKQN